ncbi:MAG: M1 family metallopeptidase, partial [Candidatus Eisenbacteria bacterium]
DGIRIVPLPRGPGTYWLIAIAIAVPIALTVAAVAIIRWAPGTEAAISRAPAASGPDVVVARADEPPRPAAPAPSPAAGRLGRDIDPLSERVSLRLDPRDSTYTGTVVITIEAKRPFGEVVLHAQDMSVESVFLAGGTVQVAPRWTSEDHGRLRVTLPERVPAGLYELTLRFMNDFDTRATALYRLQSGGEWYAFTQFEADDAREAFPCFDEPEFKIPWTLDLTVPAAHLAVSNTPIASESPAGDGMKKVVFKTSKPMPSYLVAIAAGPLETVPIEGMSIPGRVITVQGQSHLAGEAQRVAGPLLTALESYFGRPYPYEKLDLLALPEFWPGGMENAGAITFADRVLLLDPKTASLAQKRTLASITAHEMAHMWFGDLVTMRWWDDLWLNESFASWLGEKVTHEVFPEYGIEERLITDSEEAMQTDGRLTTRAIRQPVAALDNLLQSADVLAYNKGQSVLGMFEQWLGPAAFRDGVRNYVTSFAWRNAEAADLWVALGRAAKKDVGKAMGTFLDQPGLALVSVEPLAAGRVRLTQSRFLPPGSVAPSPQRWSLPVTLKYGGATGPAKTKNVFLTLPMQVVTLEPGTTWVYPNGRAWGYYRWKLPDAAIAALVARATTVLEPRERMELVYNAGALLDAGAMTGDVYLAVLETMATDPEPLVVEAAIGGLAKVKNAFVEPASAEAFARYINRALSPALERFGPSKRSGEREAVSFVRGPMLRWLASEGRNARARAYGDSLAAAYLAEPSSIDPALALAALQIAARDGDEPLWERIRTKFESAPNPAERRTYLLALASFETPALRAKSLAYALTGPLKPQETLTVPRRIAEGSEDGRAVTYEWIATHYDAVLLRLPPMLAVFMPSLGGGCSPERLARAQAFFAEPAHAPRGTEKELAKLTERVEDCVELRRREGERVKSYLNRSGVAN